MNSTVNFTPAFFDDAIQRCKFTSCIFLRIFSDIFGISDLGSDESIMNTVGSKVIMQTKQRHTRALIPSSSMYPVPQSQRSAESEAG